MQLARNCRWALLAFFIAMGILAVKAASDDSNDFDGFHRATAHLWQTGEFSRARDIERYPPTFQLLLLPLAPLPVEVAAAIWYVLNAASLIALAHLFARSFGIPFAAQLPAWLLVAAYIPGNLRLGQSAPLLLFGTAWALERARRSAAGSRAAGVAIAMLAALKVLPCAFLAIPTLLRRARRTYLGFALGLALFLGAAFAVAGMAESRSALVDWRATIEEQGPWNLIENDRSLRFGNQGLGVTLARTFGDAGEIRARNRVEIAHLPLEVIWRLYFALVAVNGLLVMRVLWMARARGDAEGWLQAFAATALAMLCISPIVWTHYFLWWLPAGLALRRHPRALYACAALSTLALTSPELRSLGVHMFGSLGLLCWIAREQTVQDRRIATALPHRAALERA